MTDTYIAAKLYVDNWRWADTPFYVRAGKRLARRETTIAIQFKRAPHPPFEEIAGDGMRPNVLLIHVQPDEGVSLAIGAKVPGAGCRSGRCTWTSSTAAPSAKACPRPTSA
jgi:glucose-6-phosphate 1-dehydrogenase